MRAPAVEVTTVHEVGLPAVASAWAALWASCPAATTFQRPEWALPWCRHLAIGVAEAVCVWRGDELTALLPLVRWRDGDADVLSLIGAGVSDCLDVLVAPEGARGALAAIAEALARAPWDRIELGELRDGSPLLDLALPGASAITPQGACPGLPLTAGRPLDHVPAGLRHELAYQRRRAARETGIEIDVAPIDVVDALSRLHAARGTARWQDGGLTAARGAFLADAIAGLTPSGAVLATTVHIGDDLAAIALGFMEREVARYYLGGFDPRHARRSPGTLAIAAAIEEAGRRGATRFDFVRGAEPYKHRFGARAAVRLHRRVVRRHAR